jgi:putative N6-adenine-specific DNA methylase
MGRDMQTGNATGSQRFFCPCPRGLEEVVQRELGSLGATALEAADGGVAFSGDLALCYWSTCRPHREPRAVWSCALRIAARTTSTVQHRV